MMNQSMNILVVDDDEVDQESIRRALREADIDSPLTIACDGVEALAILRGTNSKAPLAKPFMILLDLNMPRMNGFEFLRELRADPLLEHSLVFVLSTSQREDDIAKSYEYRVAGYVSKESAAQDFSLLAQLLHAYSRLIKFPV